MAEHNETGKESEDLAVKWLEEREYKILHRNWRHFKNEIDIIAKKDDTLHFVEVKSRKSIAYGYPEESVTTPKFKGILKAADEFLYRNPEHKWIQYDILSIIRWEGREPEYELFEDVFM